MPDAVSQIQKASWLFLGLALFSLAVFLFGAPSIGSLNPRLVTWAALVAGFVAGIGAIQCVVYLKRRELALPRVTIAAVTAGGVTLVFCGLIVALGILRVAT